MNRIEDAKSIFNKYAQSYEEIHQKSVLASGYSTDYFDLYKVQEVLHYLKKRKIQWSELLNFGCGIGKSEVHVRKARPDVKIYSCDISEESLEQAKIRNANSPSIVWKACGDSVIPFDKKFQVLFTANVFHHIPLDQRINTLKKIYNHTEDKGFFFFFEHNPWNPFTQKAVNDCSFDKDALLLSALEAKRILTKAGFSKVEVNFRLFFPGVLKFLNPLEAWMGWIPIGAQYFCVARKL